MPDMYLSSYKKGSDGHLSIILELLRLMDMFGMLDVRSSGYVVSLLVSRHASNVGYEVTLQRYNFIDKNCCSSTLYIRQIMRDATLGASHPQPTPATGKG